MIVAHTIYKNETFYQKEDNKAITFIEGAEYIIFSAEEGKMNERKKEREATNHNEEEKRIQVKTTRGIDSFRRILKEDTLLYFVISNRGYDYKFEVKILEDLYLHHKAGWKSLEEKLFPCECELIGVVHGSKEKAEPIKAHSLNELYKKTYVYFFRNDGNPACNAITRFFTEKDKVISTLNYLRSSGVTV
ncbi:MAG: hypothetical protein IPN68_16795 [Bacteroidetes bacterium]|nr:hypothetical protein [Bacteroidota bacterium]